MKHAKPLYVRGAASLGATGKAIDIFCFVSRCVWSLVCGFESILRFVDDISFLVSVMFQPARTRRARHTRFSWG